MKPFLLILLFASSSAFAQDRGALLGLSIKTEGASYMLPVSNVTVKTDSSGQTFTNKYTNTTAILCPKLIVGYRIRWGLFLGAGFGYERMLTKGTEQSYIPVFLQSDIYFSSFHKVLPYLTTRYGFNSILKNDNSVFNKGKFMLDANFGVQYMLNFFVQFNLFAGFGLRRFSANFETLNTAVKKTYTYPQLNIGLGVDFSWLKIKQVKRFAGKLPKY